MGRNVDLTGKLGMGEKPTITIGETVLTVNDSASNMLLVLDKISDGIDARDALDVAGLLFDAKSGKQLAKLDLNLDDYMTVIEAAVDLVMGGDGGNGGTPATT